MYTKKMWVTRGWLPQRAGSPSLNGGRDTAMVPPLGILTYWLI